MQYPSFVLLRASFSKRIEASIATFLRCDVGPAGGAARSGSGGEWEMQRPDSACGRLTAWQGITAARLTAAPGQPCMVQVNLLDLIGRLF